ncbi:Nucleolar complex protein 3 [Irineochytrium annulatum]|nr:Nucleolar complex protein 3 [Irineochytrium annulatum]
MSSLKTLREIGNTRDTHVLKFCLLTQLTVYRDIIPGYRIRPLTDAEKEQKVSKEVKKLRSFEEDLLTNYQAYLQQLDAALTHHLGRKKAAGAQSLKSPVDPTVAVVAAKCMSELLVTATHFNFRLNLIAAITSNMSVRSPVDVGIICCNAVKRLFEADEHGEASLEAVKLMGRMIKGKGFKVSAHVIRTFLHLKLREELAGGRDGGEKAGDKRKRKSDRVHMSKRSRKTAKFDQEVEKELKEAEAEYDKEEKAKLQTETLKQLFATYFRILKHADGTPLLPAVLEGLSRFAHLINMDFFADIIEVLKKITKEHYQKYLDGEAINIDLKDFNNSLYSQLSRLPMDPDFCYANKIEEGEEVMESGATVKHLKDRGARCEIELALMGFDILFGRKKQVPIARTAAFVKRLATVALQLPVHAILACLSILRATFIKHPRLQQLLDTEERLGSGSYKAMLDDPELCNPFATNLWELTILYKHYHPTVRTLAKHVAQCQTTSTMKNGVSNYQPLPPDLNLPPLTFLTKYNATPTLPEPSFTLVPPATIPAAIVTRLKRKAERGLTKIDGPSVMHESPFVVKLKEEAELSWTGVEVDTVAAPPRTGDAKLDKLVARERKLRKMVELAKEAQLALLDEDEDEELDEEAYEDEEDQEEEDGADIGEEEDEEADFVDPWKSFGSKKIVIK